MVLAMVGKGITSGYAMRREMQAMRGGRWSADSGSVYRVLRRLQNAGMVREVRRVGVPNRERTEYELTELGQLLVSRWMTDIPGRQELECIPDALRTRTYFLAALDPVQRARTVRNWISHNSSLICELESDVALLPPETWVRSNLLSLAKARQQWLRKLYAEVKPSKNGHVSTAAERTISV